MRQEEGESLQALYQRQEARRAQMARNRDAVRRRKARTHKLIVIGAALNSLFPELEQMSDEEIRKTVTDLFFQL